MVAPAENRLNTALSAEAMFRWSRIKTFPTHLYGRTHGGHHSNTVAALQEGAGLGSFIGAHHQAVAVVRL